MEQKLKERVVGATLLVLAGVIFIPWLLDGRGRDAEVTQSLELPRAASTSAQTRTISLNEPQAPAESFDEPAPQTSRRTQTQPATEPVAVAPVGAPETTPAPAPVVSAAESEAKPEPKAKPEPRPPVPSSADPSAAWAVQVGSFSSKSNAQRLAERLEALDYKAFVSRKVVNDRVMYRVRVGPEVSRDAAASLAERLRADSQPASIVEHPG